MSRAWRKAASPRENFSAYEIIAYVEVLDSSTGRFIDWCRIQNPKLPESPPMEELHTLQREMLSKHFDKLSEWLITSAKPSPFHLPEPPPMPSLGPPTPPPGGESDFSVICKFGDVIRVHEIALEQLWLNKIRQKLIQFCPSYFGLQLFMYYQQRSQRSDINQKHVREYVSMILSGQYSFIFSKGQVIPEHSLREEAFVFSFHEYIPQHKCDELIQSDFDKYGLPPFRLRSFISPGLFSEQVKKYWERGGHSSDRGGMAASIKHFDTIHEIVGHDELIAGINSQFKHLDAKKFISYPRERGAWIGYILEAVGERAVTQMITPLLGDTSHYYRERACGLFGFFLIPSSIPLLKEVADKDAEESVRKRAEEVLYQLKLKVLADAKQDIESIERDFKRIQSEISEGGHIDEEGLQQMKKHQESLTEVKNTVKEYSESDREANQIIEKASRLVRMMANLQPNIHNTHHTHIQDSAIGGDVGSSSASQPPPTASPSAGDGGLMVQLEKLAQMKEAGLLSEVEFTQAKQKLLNE